MSIKFLAMCIALIGAFFLVFSAELNEVKNWKPIGAIPFRATQNEEDHTICFEFENSSGEYKDIYPGISFPQGELADAVAIRFDMKVVAQDGWVGGSGRIITPKQEKHSGSFSYQPPQDGKWRTITVKMEGVNFDPAKITSIQISVGGKCRKLSCYLKNIQILDKNGKAKEF